MNRTADKDFILGTITALVVDDEPLAREFLCRMLADCGVQILGDAEEAFQAMDKIERLSPDVVFIDIQMPGVNGLAAAELFAQMERAPLVVLVTGYSEHAVEAFQGPVLDYLLKPVSPERLGKTIVKLRRQLSLQKKAQANDPSQLLDADVTVSPDPNVSSQKNEPPRLASVSHSGQPAKIQRLSVKVQGAIRLVPVERILYVMASAKRVVIKIREEELTSHESLTHLEQVLPSNFVRVHASCIVNLAAIKEILLLGNHLYSLSLVNGDEVPLSRQSYPELRRKLGIASGED
jgi:DNA-binding LytR/AlgR family response regulator